MTTRAAALVGSLAFIVESGVKRADPDPDADLPRRVAAQLEPQQLYGLYQFATYRAADGAMPVLRVMAEK